VHIKRFISGLLFLFACLLPAIAQENVHAEKFDTPPIIDGIISEEIWMKADPVTEFIQREPLNGQPATEETEVYVGFDQHNLYIAFRCYGNPENVIAKELARDVSLRYDDRIQIILDTYHDKRNAYWFQVGPRGSIGDAIVSENGAAFNKAWDGLWTGKAQIHSEGWDAELSIPFKTMGFDMESDQWGLKLIRNYMQNEETDYWPVANLNTHKFQVSDAGILDGLAGISQGLGLDIVPYGLTGADYKRDEDKVSPLLNAGLEAYYNLTPSLKAAVTLNTDFAQTEVDAQEINLTRFRLFYPEKRDFFLDGANYFNFGINGDRENLWGKRLIPFFSRRIGLDSTGNPIPVLIGGKITGQSGSWNIGAQYMKDQRNGWKNSHFAVTRISRNFGDQSQAGFITTYGNALEDMANLLLGFDVRLGTSKFRGNKNMALTMYGLKSFTTAEPSIQDPERELAYGIEFVYPNDFLHIRMGHMQIQENFVAGLGFVPRPGVRQSYGEFLLGPRPEKWGIIQIQAGSGIDYITGFDNQLLTREWNATPLKIKFVSGDEIGWKMSSTFELLEDPFSIYGDYTIPAGEHSFFWQTFSINSAQKRNLWATLDYRVGKFYNGSRNEVKLMAGYKVMVPLFVGTELVRNNVQLSDDGFIANIYRINLNILFSPDITLYNFVQYDSESNRMGWQSRFQWILQPGREIFLVWNSIANDPYERFQLEEANARLKVKFTIRF